MGLTRGLPLFAAALAILLVTAIAPQSRPLFRTQVETLAGQWHEQRNGAMPYEPTWMDELPLRPYARFRTHQEGVDHRNLLLDSMVMWADVANEPEAYAYLARLCANGALLGSKQPKSETDAQRSETRLWALELSTRRGHKLDPQNAFFPALRAGALLAQGNHDAARASWRLAGTLTQYRDYVDYESDVQIAHIEAKGGQLSSEEALVIESNVLLPHLSLINMTSRTICLQGDDRDRIAALRIAALLALSTGRSIDVFVARAVSESAMGIVRSQADLYPANHDRIAADMDAAVRSFAKRTHESSVVALWSWIDKLTSDQGTLDAGVEQWESVRAGSVRAREAGASILLAILAVLVAGAVSLAGHTLWQAPLERRRNGPLPHLLAASCWFAIAASEPRASDAPDVLVLVSLLHVVLAGQYGRGWLARGSSFVWAAATIYLMAASGFGPTAPILWAGLFVVPLSFRPNAERAVWASRAGLALSLVTAAASMIALEALVPAAAYLLARGIERHELYRRKVVTELLLIAGAVGASCFGLWVFMSGNGGLGATFLIAAIGAFFLGLLLRPTESPTRLGWCIFAIAGLFLLNMARAISADQRCEQMRYSLKHEAERLRAKLPPPAKLAP